MNHCEIQHFQNKYNSISDDEVFKILEAGKEKMLKISEEKMKKLRKLIGVR